VDDEVIVTGVEFTPVAAAGGQRLRELRQARGRTQLWVEAGADLGAGYLQRVESGRVAQPSRATVERILHALVARYGEARDVLEAFGYIVSTPLPSAADRAWAREAFQAELNEVMFPAYVLDCTARLVAWNGYLPLLLGLNAGEPLPSSMRLRSMLFSWFDPSTPLGSIVDEPETLYPALARAFRLELERFRGEFWTRELIADLQTLPRFREAWTAVMNEPMPAAAARARTSLRLKHPATGDLEFRLAAESFARDPRFRSISLFPANHATFLWCADCSINASAQPLQVEDCLA
jgi:transcriptional regulator with XRE-family HTH domain